MTASIIDDAPLLVSTIVAGELPNSTASWVFVSPGIDAFSAVLVAEAEPSAPGPTTFLKAIVPIAISRAGAIPLVIAAAVVAGAFVINTATAVLILQLLETSARGDVVVGIHVTEQGPDLDVIHP